MIAIENLQKMKYKLLDSKNALNFLYTNFINITSNEEMMMANVSQLNYVIGEILAAKRIELYKIKNILKNEAIAETLDGIVKYLEYIRNVLTKMEMSQKYNDVSAVGMQKKLKQIVDLEKLYVSYINKELLLDI
jgi:hypothetical protein